MPKFFGLRSNNGLDGPFGSAFGCLALRAAGAFAGLAYIFASSTYERKITSVQVHSSETKRRRASPRRRPSRASTPRARHPTPDAAHDIRPTRLARTLHPNATHHHVPRGDPTLARTTRARRPTTTRASRDRNPKRIATTSPSTAPMRRPHALARATERPRATRVIPQTPLPHPRAPSRTARAAPPRPRAPARKALTRIIAHRIFAHAARRASATATKER